MHIYLRVLFYFFIIIVIILFFPLCVSVSVSLCISLNSLFPRIFRLVLLRVKYAEHVLAVFNAMNVPNHGLSRL